MFCVYVRGREVFRGKHAKAMQYAFRVMNRRNCCTVITDDNGNEIARFSPER